MAQIDWLRIAGRDCQLSVCDLSVLCLSSGATATRGAHSNHINVSGYPVLWVLQQDLFVHVPQGHLRGSHWLWSCLGQPAGS